MSKNPLQPTLFIRSDLTILIQVGDRAQEISLTEDAALSLCRALVVIVSQRIDPSPADDSPVELDSPYYRLGLCSALIREVRKAISEPPKKGRKNVVDIRTAAPKPGH